MIRYASLILCAGFFFLVAQALPQERAVATLEKASSIAGQSFRSIEMVKVVNDMRQLGKERSLAFLRDYIASDRDPEKTLKVLVICRLLFVNPKGWEPLLGEALPAIDEAVAKQFPLFPVAVSNGVPFLLVEGYGGGKISAGECLKLCEGFAMIKADYSLRDHEKAARAFTQTDSFRQLYQQADRQKMADMILRQAVTTQPEQKKGVVTMVWMKGDVHVSGENEGATFLVGTDLKLYARRNTILEGKDLANALLGNKDAVNVKINLRFVDAKKVSLIDLAKILDEISDNADKSKRTTIIVHLE